MNQHNRRVVVRGLDDIEVVAEPVPRPGPGEVRVRPTVVGVCGSDTHACLGSHPFIDLPYRPGHEVVGVVDLVGEHVGGFTPGDRVVVEPNLACGRCVQCRAGRYNICAELKVFGCQTPGGLADRFVIDAGRLHPVPDSLSDVDAVLAEPLATPVRAVRSAGDLTGKSIAVLGAGPIGLLVLAAARAAGAARIAVTDLRASKRDRAAELGADVVADGAGSLAHLAGSADVVFDCVARRASLAQAVSLVVKGGEIVVVGVGSPGETAVRLDLVQDREIVVRGSLMFVAEDFTRSLRLLTEGAVRAEDIVTSVFDGLDTAAAAFRATTDPEECKVLIRP
ncbi:alcohol dehydrogenase catalytic domain-containing protein [Amycolatopsis stemonae]